MPLLRSEWNGFEYGVTFARLQSSWKSRQTFLGETPPSGRSTKPTIIPKTSDVPSKVKSGVKVYDSPAEPPVQSPIDELGVYADWLDPIGFMVAEGVQGAKALGSILRNKLWRLPRTSTAESFEAAGAAGQSSGSGIPSAAKVLYPRGKGASIGPVPSHYTKVSRWVNESEANLWMANESTTIPAGVGTQGERVYVTLPGAARPGGTGPIRIDFHVPREALQAAGKADWRQILQPMQNPPIYNVEIHYP